MSTVIDYEGRRFRKVGDTDGAVAHYRQRGTVVWADFGGGEVSRGAVAGICDPDGTLRLAYCMVLATGEVISGRSVNRPRRRPDGVLVIREEWERFGEHAATGISYLEELPARGLGSNGAAS